MAFLSGNSRIFPAFYRLLMSNAVEEHQAHMVDHSADRLFPRLVPFDRPFQHANQQRSDQAEIHDASKCTRFFERG